MSFSRVKLNSYLNYHCIAADCVCDYILLLRLSQVLLPITITVSVLILLLRRVSLLVQSSSSVNIVQVNHRSSTHNAGTLFKIPD